MATPFDKGKINQQDIQETIDSSKTNRNIYGFYKVELNTRYHLRIFQRLPHQMVA